MTNQNNDHMVKTKNLLPNDHKYLTFLKKVFRHEFRKNGFRRLSTPFFEEINFWKKIFKDNLDENVLHFSIWDKEVWLNPLPSIFNLKAYIEEERKEELQPVYSYYMDMYYPVDKKNKNDIKWVWLFWWDIIWENDIIIDVQNLFIISDILKKIWFQNDYTISYNFTWTKKEQEKYKEKIIEFLEDKKHLLTEETKEKLKKGKIFDIFKTENEDEKILFENLPKISKFYKKDSKKDIEKLSRYIEILWLDIKQNDFLFWDYDFNDGLIWEIKDNETWKIIAKWYWYNELSNLLGETKEIPGSWFWVDIFALIDKLKQKDLKIKNKDKLDLFFVQLWDKAKEVVLPLTIQARQAWIKTAVSLGTPSMKEQMLKANRSKASYVVMVWVMEANSWVFQLRDLATGKQKEIKKDELIDYIIDKIWKENLDFYDPSKDLSA